MKHDKYRVPKQDKKDEATLRACIKVLKRQCGRRCRDYALGCFSCGIWRVIDDLKTWIWLGED